MILIDFLNALQRLRIALNKMKKVMGPWSRLLASFVHHPTEDNFGRRQLMANVLLFYLVINIFTCLVYCILAHSNCLRNIMRVQVIFYKLFWQSKLSRHFHFGTKQTKQMLVMRWVLLFFWMSWNNYCKINLQNELCQAWPGWTLISEKVGDYANRANTASLNLLAEKNKSFPVNSSCANRCLRCKWSGPNASFFGFDYMSFSYSISSFLVFSLYSVFFKYVNIYSLWLTEDQWPFSEA